MKDYFKGLEKIEFVVTYACTGKCKHCSEGDHPFCGERIDPKLAAGIVKKVTSAYKIKTVMAFGGEPLLYPESVFSIMSAAFSAGVPKRQVITNGCFSKNYDRIRDVVKGLHECGVNDLLVSADAFHQETIPLDVVKRFALEAKRVGIPVRVQPAWLVNREHDNPYNKKTKDIVAELASVGLPAGEGNVIFPEGNALKYLGQYMEESLIVNPYKEDPENVKCLSFDPNGDVLGMNVYQTDIMEIIDSYRP